MRNNLNNQVTEATAENQAARLLNLAKIYRNYRGSPTPNAKLAIQFGEVLYSDAGLAFRALMEDWSVERISDELNHPVNS